MSAAKHTPGTLYPAGHPAHTPDMCSHRHPVRHGYHGTTTGLCYEPGKWELVRTDGTIVEVNTAEGLMPYRRCDKHVKGWAESYAPDKNKRCIEARSVRNPYVDASGECRKPGCLCMGLRSHAWTDGVHRPECGQHCEHVLEGYPPPDERCDCGAFLLADVPSAHECMP